jgi:hypothetical protein
MTHQVGKLQPYCNRTAALAGVACRCCTKTTPKSSQAGPTSLKTGCYTAPSAAPDEGLQLHTHFMTPHSRFPSIVEEPSTHTNTSHHHYCMAEAVWPATESTCWPQLLLLLHHVSLSNDTRLGTCKTCTSKTSSTSLRSVYTRKHTRKKRRTHIEQHPASTHAHRHKHSWGWGRKQLRGICSPSMRHVLATASYAWRLQHSTPQHLSGGSSGIARVIHYRLRSPSCTSQRRERAPTRTPSRP